MYIEYERLKHAKTLEYFPFDITTEGVIPTVHYLATLFPFENLCGLCQGPAHTTLNLVSRFPEPSSVSPLVSVVFLKETPR